MKCLKSWTKNFFQEHAGPTDIISFLEIYDYEEISITKRDVYEQIAGLIKLLRNNWV